jgi:hypothetical protein
MFTSSHPRKISHNQLSVRTFDSLSCNREVLGERRRRVDVELGNASASNRVLILSSPSFLDPEMALLSNAEFKSD